MLGSKFGSSVQCGKSGGFGEGLLQIVVDAKGAVGKKFVQLA